jgi:hypothetical protein
MGVGSYLNGIGASVLQEPGKVHPLRDGGSQFMTVFGDIEKGGNRKVRSAALLDFTDDITHKPCSVFQGGTAVFVIAFIPDTGEIGIDLVAGTAIYFHTIKAGLLSSLSCLGPDVHILFNLGKA